MTDVFEGLNGAPDLPHGISLTAIDAAKKVSKHWGEERWLVHGDAPFVMKMIHLNAGTRTSLQFHRYKEEANLVISGRVRLHFQSSKGRDETCELGPGTVMHIQSAAVHRVEALTDVIMIEVSTPEVDDVVRCSDDWNRPDGKIDSEHLQP
jgi:mannose-6-phosphate isomerase-like protein (cupin superfamily)